MRTSTSSEWEMARALRVLAAKPATSITVSTATTAIAILMVISILPPRRLEGRVCAPRSEHPPRSRAHCDRCLRPVLSGPVRPAPA